jgi:hypothetical protein
MATSLYVNLAGIDLLLKEINTTPAVRDGPVAFRPHLAMGLAKIFEVVNKQKPATKILP